MTYQKRTLTLKHAHLPALVAAISLGSTVFAQTGTTSWRYYRPGNTGIQGDFNESLWVAPDGDPWIAGYNPVAEEGGMAKFIQAENRWVNVSNIDYSAFGSANDVGTSRVSDMVPDGAGNLWIGTWRGLLRMNLAAGPSSLVKFDQSNSPLPGGLTRDVTIAPDGSIWVSAESAIWAGGGLTRYEPTTNTWTHFENRGGGRIAAQPKQGGGFAIWTSGTGSSGMDRWDSTTQAWTHIPYAIGNPVYLVSKDSVDAAGNMWVVRLADNQGMLTLDCMRPDGSWITPPLPPITTQLAGPFSAMKPHGDRQAYAVVIGPDLAYHLNHFDGTSWTDMGTVPHNAFIDALDFAPDGTIWVCGTGQGGVSRRDAQTGRWQRYRVTNTSQFDLFNNDLTISPITGDVYACANAGPDVGGMVKFDGARWTCFVNHLDYGLGGPWPFVGSPQSESIYVRPSNGHLIVNPINAYTHEFDGAASWNAVPGAYDQMSGYVEDSLGRLWGIGHYGNLGIFQQGGFAVVPGGGMFSSLRADPDRPGTVWCNSGGLEVVRTDGTYRFSRSVADFPVVNAIGASFTGLAADHNNVAWIGTTAQSDGTGGTLIRLDADSGTHQMWRHDLGWPFPGDQVTPRIVTPDGRVWMTYESAYPSTNFGLLAWDGTNVTSFPAPPDGQWQFGGLPHHIILDIEVKVIASGYELWMSCVSRGIAVLTVTNPPVCVADFNSDGSLAVQDIFDFLNAWFNGSPAADINGGGLSVQDLFDYPNAWFSGCP